MENARQAAARLQDRQKLVDSIARNLEAYQRRLQETDARLIERRDEQQGFAAIISRAQEIEAAYAGWQNARLKLTEIEKIAGQFRESEKQREAPRLEIQADRARLEQERLGLLQAKEAADRSKNEAGEARLLLESARTDLKLAETRLESRALLEASAQEMRQRQTEMRLQNTSLRQEMIDLDERIKTLEASEEAECPLCGQPLLPADRKALIERLKVEGNEKGDRFRENKTAALKLDEELRNLETQVSELNGAEAETRQHTTRAAQFEQKALALEVQASEWQGKGASPRFGGRGAILHRRLTPWQPANG